jgi:hypothetical protein
VTIVTRDWLYARDWLSATHRGDEDAAERLRRAWLYDIQEATAAAEHLSRDLFGRTPPQILLLHANRLNAEHLEEALDWYDRRGYRFITLDEALADPAYREEVRVTSRIGQSRWVLLRRTRAQLADDRAAHSTPDGARREPRAR